MHLVDQSTVVHFAESDNPIDGLIPVTHVTLADGREQLHVPGWATQKLSAYHPILRVPSTPDSYEYSKYDELSDVYIYDKLVACP